MIRLLKIIGILALGGLLLVVGFVLYFELAYSDRYVRYAEAIEVIGPPYCYSTCFLGGSGLVCGRQCSCAVRELRRRQRSDKEYVQEVLKGVSNSAYADALAACTDGPTRKAVQRPPPNKGLQLTAYAVARLGVYPPETTSGVHQPAVTSAAAEPLVR